jgi:hypothetical protein
VVYLNQKQLTSQLIFIPDCVFFVAFSKMRLNEFTKKENAIYTQTISFSSEGKN